MGESKERSESEVTPITVLETTNPKKDHDRSDDEEITRNRADGAHIQIEARYY